jgi:hypothetical protein
MDLEPQNAPAHSWLGHAYEENKQYSEALNEYEVDTLLVATDEAGTKAHFKEIVESLSLGGERGWYQNDLDHLQMSKSAPSFRVRPPSEPGRSRAVRLVRKDQ